MAKLCDIVICVWNQKHLIEGCVESIIKNTAYPYRLIIVDNASDKPTADYLESLKADDRLNVVIIRNEKNLGNTKAVNQGLLFSDSTYVCNLDNDTYVTKGWLTEMVKMAEMDDNIGLVGPSNGGMYPPKSASFSDIELKAQEMHTLRGTVVEAVTLDGFCLLIKREVIKVVGVWDEIYSPGYFDDTDYCMLVGKSGYRIVHAQGAYVYHIEGSSFKSNPRKEELFLRNKNIFEERYGRFERVLFVVGKNLNAKETCFKENISNELKNANWVVVIQKKSFPLLNLSKHTHIKQLNYLSIIFYLQVLRKVFFHKKKFNKIFTTSENWRKIFILLKSFHSADVIMI